MIRLTEAAAAQIASLLHHYMRQGRDEAVSHLQTAVRRALADIAVDPGHGRAFPGPYSEIGRWGYRWIKVHRYWFGYREQAGEIVVTNVLFETADLPRRVAPDPPDE